MYCSCCIHQEVGCCFSITSITLLLISQFFIGSHIASGKDAWPLVVVWMEGLIRCWISEIVS